MKKSPSTMTTTPTALTTRQTRSSNRASSSMDRAGLPPRPASGSNKKRKTSPAEGSADKVSSSTKKSKKPTGKRKGERKIHLPEKKEDLKAIRIALIKNPKQQSLTISGGRRISLKPYKPADSNNGFFGLELECCVYYNHLPSIPPDHPCEADIRGEALDRIPDNYEKDGIPLMLVQNMIFEHFSSTYDISEKKLWPVIHSIAEKDPALSIQTPAPTASAGGSDDTKAAGIMDILDKTAIVVAGNAAGIAGNAAGIAGNAAGIKALTAGQDLLNKKTGDLADGQKILFETTADLADGQKLLNQKTDHLEEEVSTVKKQLKEVSESAQKQYNDLAATVHSAAAKSIGGTRLFDSPFRGGDGSYSSPLASPLLTSPLLTVPESGTNNELLGLAEIASRSPDLLVERCKSLVADSHQLSEDQLAEWNDWHKENLGKGQRVSSLNDILKQGTAYCLKNPSDLGQLESFEALADELQQLDGLVIVGSHEKGDTPVCVMGPFSDIYQTCPFLMTQVLPAFYGAKYEYMLTTGDGDNLSVASASPEAAMETLGAILSLASKKNKEVVTIQPDSTDPNTSHVKVEVHLPELQVQHQFEKLEFQSCKLPESMAAALSSCTRVLKLSETEVYDECASVLFGNITSGQSNLEVLEIHNDVTIPNCQMVSLVQNKSSCVLSYKSGAWNQLPEDVSDAHKQQIVAAMTLGGTDLPLAIDPSDVLKGPLKAVKDDLVSWLKSSDHPTMKRICAEGAKALPFKIDPLKANLVNEVKEWARKLFGDGGEPGAKQQKRD